MDSLRRPRTRPGFHDKPVRGLSFAIAVIGCLCFGIGVGSLVYSLVVRCEYRNTRSYNDDYDWNNRRYNEYGDYYPTTFRTTTSYPYFYDQCHYLRTYASPGIWSGLTFIASGVIGGLASGRKTTCYIVSMMVLSVVSTWIAVGGIGIALTLNLDFDFYYEWDVERVGSYPIELLILNLVVAFFCCVVFVLSWINFGFACRAVCCNGQAGLPTMKKRNQYPYQTLQTAPPMMYATQPMNTQDDGAPAVPIFQPLPNPQSVAVEPVYLVQGRQVIGILPQNPQFPPMGNSAVQLNPATTQSAVPPQQV